MYPLDFEEGKKNNDNRQLIFEGKYKNGKRQNLRIKNNIFEEFFINLKIIK